MNKRQIEISEGIKIFEREKRELQTVLAHSLYEEVMFGIDNSVSTRYQEGINLVDLRIAELNTELDRVSDCETFIQEFGKEVHDAFKRIYTINHKTEVRKDTMLAKLKTFNYVLPASKTRVYAISETPEPYTRLDKRQAEVKDFYIPGRGYILFVYMPETNVMLWCED